GANPASEGRRAFPDVDGHVVHSSRKDLDELSLSLRLLEVQPAEGALPGAGDVVLHELQGDAGFGIALCVVTLDEGAARIPNELRLDEQDTGTLELDVLHAGPFPS